MGIDLEKYLNDGLERLVTNALKVTLKNPKQSAFFLRFASSARKAEKRRREYGLSGEHIPTFLIASITENCNLNCAGCYAHANHSCAESAELNSAEWGRIFSEAEELGISIILIAGGEPMLRFDVLAEASNHKAVMFPVFTNGTLLDDKALRLFDVNRNLVPILSIEGGELATDIRRGEGVFRQAASTMRLLHKKGMPFGASITVTKENYTDVTDVGFIDELERGGCKAVLFVEYVPFETPELAMGEAEREKLADRLETLRLRERDMIIISFPGDEAGSGGCLAAGRGFFHISASGAAEPCPFSPYSDMNLRDVSVRVALKSPLFARLSAEDVLNVPHKGGCALFEQQETVAAMASEPMLSAK